MNKIQELIEAIKDFNKKKVSFDDKKFGKLLKPGDKIKITDLETNKQVKREVEKFDGIEYRMKGLSSSGNLGHNGYFVVDDKTFLLVMNMEPVLRVEKI